MRRRALLLLLALLPAAASAGKGPAGRSHLLRDEPAEAVAAYSRVRLTKNPAVAAEYAYAAALAGFKDLALGHLDHALELQQNNPTADGTVNYFAARVFDALGQDDIAAELSAQGVRPAWVPENFAPRRPAPEPPPFHAGDYATDVALANTLLFQHRYYTAADRFQRLVTRYPNDARSFAGYAIALEKIGAYRKASRAVARALELEGAGISPEKKAVYTAHKQELETRAQTPPAPLPLASKANLSLKGRYLAFLGGNISRNNANTVSNVNARLGKFFTNRFDASVTSGYTGGNIPDDYRGVSFGLAGRYHQPLPVQAPLNATFGSRVDYQPRPSKKTAVVVSPGLSWVTESGSFDVFYEYGVSGRLKKAGTISVGFTSYIGRSK
jgi:hypothetical protein